MAEIIDLSAFGPVFPPPHDITEAEATRLIRDALTQSPVVRQAARMLLRHVCRLDRGVALKDRIHSASGADLASTPVHAERTARLAALFATCVFMMQDTLDPPRGPCDD